jgi:hypothetical protein
VRIGLFWLNPSRHCFLGYSASSECFLRKKPKFKGEAVCSLAAAGVVFVWEKNDRSIRVKWKMPGRIMLVKTPCHRLLRKKTCPLVKGGTTCMVPKLQII